MMFDVEQSKLVNELAAELKRQNVVVPPDWAAFVKTGHHRERPPVDENWWYVRAASILRAIYLRGPIGTEKLRVKFGGRKNRGVAPDKFYAAGGNHIRKIMQQLEMAKLIQQAEKGAHKGRVITPLGRKLIHAIAGVVKAKATPQRVATKQKKEKAAPKESPKEATPEKVTPKEATPEKATPKESESTESTEAKSPSESKEAPAKEGS